MKLFKFLILINTYMKRVKTLLTVFKKHYYYTTGPDRLCISVTSSYISDCYITTSFFNGFEKINNYKVSQTSEPLLIDMKSTS